MSFFLQKLMFLIVSSSFASRSKKYRGIPIFRPSKRNESWFKKSDTCSSWLNEDRCSTEGGMRFLVRVIGRVEKKSVLWLTFFASLNYASSLINPRSSFHAVFSLTLQSSCPTPFYHFNFSSSFICQKIQQKVNSFDFKAQYHALLYFHVFIF